MHVVLLTLGTDGDIFPFVSLGIELRARGHRITLATSESFRSLALKHGFSFTALVSTEEMDLLLGNPDFWHPLKTVAFSAKWAARGIARQFEVVRQLASAPDSVLVANPAIFGAALVHETMQRPLVTVVLQPWMLPSYVAPPEMPMISFPSWTPPIAFKALWRIGDAVGDFYIGRELNRVRAQLKLPPARRLFSNWLSKQLVIGMFPDWYGPPQSDWPKAVKLAGFPMFNGGSAANLDPELLEFCAARPTVAFTFGSGMMHSEKLFREGIESCRILGIQGIVLTKYLDQLPAKLPPFIRHVTFAPFDLLFPCCAAVVHHGGIGTVAKALAAGTPQLILPLAFDQMDNAARIRRFGVGTSIKAKLVSGKTIARELRHLLDQLDRGNCRKLSERFAARDGAEIAASWVERLDIA